jgi:hypothetical protein
MQISRLYCVRNGSISSERRWSKPGLPPRKSSLYQPRKIWLRVQNRPGLTQIRVGSAGQAILADWPDRSGCPGQVDLRAHAQAVLAARAANFLDPDPTQMARNLLLFRLARIPGRSPHKSGQRGQISNPRIFWDSGYDSDPAFLLTMGRTNHKRFP